MVYMERQAVRSHTGSEVDLNGSLWYKQGRCAGAVPQVLKLTSTGHYGIRDVELTVEDYEF